MGNIDDVAAMNIRGDESAIENGDFRFDGRPSSILKSVIAVRKKQIDLGRVGCSEGLSPEDYRAIAALRGSHDGAESGLAITITPEDERAFCKRRIGRGGRIPESSDVLDRNDAPKHGALPHAQW